jgi:hypothetical protein
MSGAEAITISAAEFRALHEAAVAPPPAPVASGFCLEDYVWCEIACWANRGRGDRETRVRYVTSTTGISEATLDTWIERLVGQGYIVSQEAGMFTVTVPGLAEPEPEPELPPPGPSS